MALNVLKIDDWLNSQGVQFIFIDESAVQRIKDGEVFQTGDFIGVVLESSRGIYTARCIYGFDDDCVHVHCIRNTTFQINDIIIKVKLENGGAKWIKC